MSFSKEDLDAKLDPNKLETPFTTNGSVVLPFGNKIICPACAFVVCDYEGKLPSTIAQKHGSHGHNICKNYRKYMNAFAKKAEIQSSSRWKIFVCQQRDNNHNPKRKKKPKLKENDDDDDEDGDDEKEQIAEEQKIAAKKKEDGDYEDSDN